VGDLKEIDHRYFAAIDSSSVKTVADRQICYLSEQALLTKFSELPPSMTFNGLKFTIFFSK